MNLSVVIPTKNEAANIAACVRSFDGAVPRGEVEVIVVDNASTDETKKIAAGLGAVVYDKGPERCAQRNLGWKTARTDWVLFLDADMIIPPETLDEIFSILSAPVTSADAYFIPEFRSGRGFRAKARNFERSFYDGTCIDGLRLVRRSLLERVGGYDETLVACEDWDLDRRLVAAGARTGILGGYIIHNEAKLPLAAFLAKKAYYSASVGRYRAKWKEDARVRRQFGLYYRFIGVFVEKGKWRKILRHPILFVGVIVERFAVGLTYLLNRGR